MASAEKIVLAFFEETNRPHNAQVVTDNMQKHGIKKAAVQKAMDNLAEKGKLTCKEFGKAKIYFPNQDSVPKLTKEEQEGMRRESAALSALVKAESEAVNDLKQKIQGLKSSLTVKELQEKLGKLTQQNEAMESKLAKLESGAQLVTPEAKAKVEKRFNEMMDAWRKRKSVFREIYDPMMENYEGSLKELKEELGIEEDKDVGVDYNAYLNMFSSVGNKRARTLGGR